MDRIVSIDMEMPQLNRKRRIRVYLPKDYHQTDKRYPVLYMHDGQNLFYDDEASYGSSWKMGESLDKIYDTGVNSGVILVAIDNNPDGLKRLDEYCPWVSLVLKEYMAWIPVHAVGGEGVPYGEFIVETLKPYIDNNFRTYEDAPNTAIAGSSMGGIISLYVGLKYRDVFANIGMFSPAIWAIKDELYGFLNEADLKQSKIYLDIGTAESSDPQNKEFANIYLNDALELEKYLKPKIDKEKLTLVVDEDGVHNERAWAKRFPGFVGWIFNK